MMMTLETAQGKRFPIDWIGVSDMDQSLRFEIINQDEEYDVQMLCQIFADPMQTRRLTRCDQRIKKSFDGYTKFKGIEQMTNGNIVIRLWPKDYSVHGKNGN